MKDLFTTLGTNANINDINADIHIDVYDRALIYVIILFENTEGNTEVAEFLIKEEDLNAINGDAQTLLDLVNDLESQGRDMKKIKDLLIEAGAKTGGELIKSLFRKVPLGRGGRVSKIGEEKKQKVVLKLVPLGRDDYPCDGGIKENSR